MLQDYTMRMSNWYVAVGCYNDTLLTLILFGFRENDPFFHKQNATLTKFSFKTLVNFYLFPPLKMYGIVPLVSFRETLIYKPMLAMNH